MWWVHESNLFVNITRCHSSQEVRELTKSSLCEVSTNRLVFISDLWKCYRFCEKLRYGLATLGCCFLVETSEQWKNGVNFQIWANINNVSGKFLAREQRLAWSHESLGGNPTCSSFISNYFIYQSNCFTWTLSQCSSVSPISNWFNCCKNVATDRVCTLHV